MSGVRTYFDPRRERRARCISTWGVAQNTVMVSRRREGLLQFSSHKARGLEKVDLSRKGSVDDAIMPMVKLLNSTDEYYTTSSCSGRISIFCEVVTVIHYCSVCLSAILFTCRTASSGRKDVTGCLYHMTPLTSPN